MVDSIALRLAAVLLVLACHSSSAGAETSGVVIVYDERTDLPGLAALDASLVQTLRGNSDATIDIYRETMDRSRFASPEYLLTLRDHLRTKYAQKEIDLAIAVMGPALDFLLAHGAEVFPRVPIVFCGIDRRELGSRPLPAQVTGVLVRREFRPTIELAARLQPGINRVVVVGGTSQFDARLLEQAKDEFLGLRDRFTFTYLSALPLKEQLAEVSRLPAHTVVLFTTMFKDGAGDAVVPHEVAERLAAAANVPVYVALDQYVGRGVIGGHVYSVETHGRAAAVLALQVLAGGRPSDLPLVDGGTSVTMVDWRQLQRWRVPLSRLPPGSIIRFRTPTPWETYGVYVAGVGTIVAVQALLIVALLAQRARRRRAEETIRTREASLRTSYDRIRHLAGRLLQAQETTRAQIAQDLHDGVCQELAGVSIAIGSLKRSVAQVQDPPTQQVLSEIEDETRRTYEEIRRFSHDLHPATLRLLGVGTALNALCSEMGKRYGVTVSLTVEGDLGHVHPDVAVCCFRIAQESIRNGIVHGKAGRIEVSLARVGEQFELTVTDNGRGFDVEAVRRNGNGLGLVSIEERARLFGGDVQVVSGQEQGTTIRVRLEAVPHQSGPASVAGSG